MGDVNDSQHGTGRRPADHVVGRELDGEYVVLNTLTQEAHRLSDDAAVVWRALVGSGSSALDVDVQTAVLEDLDMLGLLAPVDGVPSQPTRRSLLRAGAIGGAAAGIATLALPTAAFALSNDLPFFSGSAGGPYQVHVPSYVTRVTCTVKGGGGAGTSAGPTGRPGGSGAQFDGTIVFPPNHPPVVLEVYVGGRGTPAGPGGAAGFQGGGSGGAAVAGFVAGGGGGGASAIVVSGVPVLVAGGGGGAGSPDTAGSVRGGVGGDAGLFTENVDSAAANGGRFGARRSLEWADGGNGGVTLANGSQQRGTGGLGGDGTDGQSGSATAAGGAGGNGGLGVDAPSGGGGGGGWAGGGGGQSGAPAANLVSSGAGGGGGSSLMRVTGGINFASPVFALAGNGGIAGANGGSGSVTLTVAP